MTDEASPRPMLTNFGARKLEWVMALYTVGFGLWLILPPASMSSASFVGALSLLPESEWGALYAVVGNIHLVALQINGRAAWTPFARLLALILNSQVFLALCISLIPANFFGTGVFTYGAFGLLFCGVALVAAAIDCGREIKIWRHRHEPKH